MKNRKMLVPANKEPEVVEVVRPIVEREVVIKGMEPNILIAQNHVALIPNPNNSFPVFLRSMVNHDQKEQYVLAESLFNAFTDKLIFLLTDVYMSALNVCIADGIISPAIVDIKDFRPDFIVNRSEIESDIALCATRYSQNLFNKLYQYAVFGRNSDTEDPNELINYLNTVVSSSSNLITHHIATYYNDMITSGGIAYGSYSHMQNLGLYDNAYREDNVIGSLFGIEEDVKKNNEFIEYTQGLCKGVSGMFEFEEE